MLSDIFRLVANDDVETLQGLIDSSPELIHSRDGCGWTPLHQACGSCSLGAAALLLERGADVNALGDSAETPMHLADGIAMVRLLLVYGADPRIADLNGMTPMSFASIEKNRMLEELLQGAIRALEQRSRVSHN